MDGKMSSEDGKNRGFVVAHHHESYPPQAEPPPSEFPPPPPPPQPYYGTFQGVPTYPPAFGFPQNAPPPVASDPQYYSHGYQSVPGYAVADGLPITSREPRRRLPCCGIGIGWFLFILGFFLAGIPWYVGAILLICTRRSLDYREKPGYVLCTIAAVLVTVAIVLGATKGNDDWDWDWDW